MARRSKRSNNRKKLKRGQREYNRFSKRNLLYPSALIVKPKKHIKKRSLAADDKRKWSPYRYPERKLIDGRPVSYTLESQRKDRFRDDTTNARIAFADPKRTVVCVRRRRRRQALFANQKVGKGISGSKIRKYNQDSKIKC